VGLIEVEGTIYDAGVSWMSWSGWRTTGGCGAVVRIDSPGGGVAATQEIHHALLDYQTRAEIPIVASLGSTAASGGYYVACAADRIVPNRAR